MRFQFTPEQLVFQKEANDFLKSESDLMKKVEWETDSGGGFGPDTEEFLKKLGKKGLLTPSWPKKYGGLEASYMYRFIVSEAIAEAGGPPSPVGVSMAGPVVLMVGSEELKNEFLPKISRGEVEFALGYSEPQAGSDLASLDMRAVEDGDDFVMNGQKVFNTACHYAHYHWLAARTDPNVAKHKGISMFIVDMKSPGITIRPLWGMGGFRTNEVFYDNVRVPKRNLVGEKNKGWYYLAKALDFERTYVIGTSKRFFRYMLEYARETKVNGKPLAQDPLIRQKLGETAVEIEMAYLLAGRVAWIIDSGTVPNYEASMIKMVGSELERRILQTAMELMGLYGQLDITSKWATKMSMMERQYQIRVNATLVRGTTEVMKNIVALRGLGLPQG